MTQEEKAKAYDEAVERAKSYYIDAQIDFKKSLENLFPELKESEDERIRKGLIQYFKDFTLDTFAGLDPKKILAWLEKQGQTEYDKDMLGAIEYCKKNNRPLEKEHIAWLEKQDEQKPSWSEEDERIYQSIMDDTVQENQLNDKQTNWLRDIKYRYFPQPKQEWSVDDERAYRSVLYNFEHHFPLNCVQQEFVKSHIQPHNRWEPSEGQLECLGYVIEKAEKDWSPLTNNRIYLTLKELKEQLNKLRSDTRVEKII